ncbi:MAG: ABC transporter ATP-binding protein [Patescibacteria group bacterium]
MVIETKNLSKYYGKIKGIDDLTLQINEGEIFGFLGPNGSGKTTTIRLLMGLLKPTNGSAKIFSLDTQKKSVQIKKDVSLIPGDVHLYDKMKGGELIEYIDKLNPKKESALKDQLIERLDFNPDRKIKAYSKGNKQKLAVIIALMHQPKLLVLDEPTVGLDPLMQQEIYKILREFKENGGTIFLSSHFLPEVDRVCDRVGIVKDGNLVSIETIDGLRSKTVRHLDVLFEDQVNPQEFQVLSQVVSVNKINHYIRITVQGEVDTLIKHVAKYKIKDLIFNQASLEDFFMEFYKK